MNRDYLMSLLRRRFDRSFRADAGHQKEQRKRFIELRAEETLERLLKYNLMRVGLVIVCKFCGQRNWYALANLDELNTCERFLQKTPFPASLPSETQWEYRPIGPFATENFAHGAYTTALTLRFLEVEDFRDGVYVPGLEIETESGDVKAEADFAMFARDRWRGPLSLILGECKTSERRFVSKDFKQATLRLRCVEGSI